MKKKLFSLVMAAAMLMTMAVPAFATGGPDHNPVGDNSITITNSPVYTSADGTTKKGADYSGYLLMTLVTSEKCTDTDPSHEHGSACYNYAYTVNPKYTNILLKVINENKAEGTADLTVAATDRVPTAAENNAIVSWISTNVGEGTGKLMNARDFTNAVYKEILALNSDTDDTNNIVADKTASDENADGTVTLDSIAHGYWLIADTTTGIPGDATADRTSTLVILDTSTVTVIAKNNEMTITKDITNPDPTNVSDHNIGDTVNYTIVATIDPNMAQYDPATYTYIITDTLSKGVVYDLDPTNDALEEFDGNNVKQVKTMMGLTIRLDNDGNGTIDAGEGQDISEYFTVELLKDPDLNDGFTFTITGNTSGDHIWAKSGKTGNVIVNYNAIVNKFAVVGGDGNPNEVDLEFSNNPNTDSTGETPKDIVTSFTYQLNVTKVDGKDERVTLKDARFALYRLVDDTVNGGQKKEYVLIDANNKVSGWQDTLPTVTLDEKTVNGNIVTDGNGKMSVSGLDAGTYYLTECVAPDGYNLLDKDVKIKITAEYSPDGKTITKLTVTVDDTETSNGNVASGVLEVTVKNFSGIELPGTGGIGTTIFYTLGGLLAVGAVVLLVTKKRVHDMEG